MTTSTTLPRPIRRTRTRVLVFVAVAVAAATGVLSALVYLIFTSCS